MIKNTDEKLKKAITNVANDIGQTELKAFGHWGHKKKVAIFGKLEWQQLGGSVKARPAYNIIKQAIFSGELTAGKTLIDASSGNTGIAYASIGQRIGIDIEICLPGNASKERIDLLKKLGATITSTSPFGGTDEAQERAAALVLDAPEKYFYANQYANINNWKSHYSTTAEEIFTQTNGEITHFIAGLGTTGTMMGTGKRLKELKSDIKLIGLQPDIALHGLEGWKHLETAVVPDIYQPELLDKIIEVSTEEAYKELKFVNTENSLLLSPSSAANLAGAKNVAKTLESGVIVTVFPDNAAKYGEVIQDIFNKKEYAT